MYVCKFCQNEYISIKATSIGCTSTLYEQYILKFRKQKGKRFMLQGPTEISYTLR